MNSVLLPGRESEKLDESKCFVTLAQIENLITATEQRYEELIADYVMMGDSVKKGNVTFTKNAIADMITRNEGKLNVLKEIRHMAYVNGGYRN